MLQRSHLQEERIFGQSLERFQQEGRKDSGRLDHLTQCRRSTGIFQLVKFTHCNLLTLSLIRNIWFVDLESVSVEDEEFAPVLFRFWLLICLFDPNQKAPLKVEQGVEVEENVVHGIAGDDTLLFDELLERLQ